MKIADKPHQLLLFMAIAVAIFSFFSTSTIDLHIHDTMIVIDSVHIYLALATALLFLWLLYHFSRKILFSRVLSWLHVSATIIASLIMVTQPWVKINTGPVTFEQFQQMNRIITGFFLFLLAGQIVFLVHLVLGFIKRFRRS